MFDTSPKERTPLPEAYCRIYEKHYTENRKGSTFASLAAQRVERWNHIQVVKSSPPHIFDPSTLELGAGTLTHLNFESSTQYDIVEPCRFFYENSENLPKVRQAYALIEDIPLMRRYDRIISCGVLEHIVNLPFVVSKSGLLLTEQGCFCAAVPSEGGLLWKLGYSLTTGLEFRLRYHLKYSVLMQYEHCNTVDEVEESIRYFFSHVRMTRFGIGKHGSLFTFFCAHSPDIERCSAYYMSEMKISP